MHSTQSSPKNLMPNVVGARYLLTSKHCKGLHFRLDILDFLNNTLNTHTHAPYDSIKPKVSDFPTIDSRK